MPIVDRSVLLGPENSSKNKTVSITAFDGDVVVKRLSGLVVADIQAKATEMRNTGDGQVLYINSRKSKVLQILHGLIDPKLNSELEVEQFMDNWGPDAIEEVIDAIDEASETSEEATAATTDRFQEGEVESGTDGPDAVGRAGAGPAGADGGENRPDLPG